MHSQMDFQDPSHPDFDVLTKESRHIIALDFDLTGNLVSFPADKKVTDHSYEQVLDEQGIDHKHTRTLWDVVGACVMVVCLMLLHPFFGYVYGVVLLMTYRAERLHTSEEERYMKHMRNFFAFARCMCQPVLIVTRNTKYNVEYVLKRAGVENMDSIVILSDPSRERNKCEMVWDWMQNDCDAWCEKFAPKQELLKRHETKDHFPVVTFYDDSETELQSIRDWAKKHAPRMIVDTQSVCRPGKHEVNGKRVHRTYKDCVDQKLPRPGIFNQREPCVVLWKRLSRVPFNTLCPPFYILREPWRKDKDQ